jgi:hypothetical protein
VYHNHQEEVIGTGQFYNAYFSIGQRKGNTNFNASFQSTKNEGIIFGLNGYERQNYRINVDQQLAQRLDASFSAFYGTSSNGRSQEGPGSAFFGITFVEPDTDILAQCTQAQVEGGTCTKELGNPDGSPYRAFIPDKLSNATNPLYNLTNQEITTNRNRFTGSARARWRMLDWLSAEGSFNYDQEQQEDKDYTPLGYLANTGLPTDGNLVRSQFMGRTYNTNMTLTAINTWGKINNTTKVAYIYEDQVGRFLGDSASKLLVNEVPHLGSTDFTQLRAASTEQQIRNQNLYANTTFGIRAADTNLIENVVYSNPTGVRLTGDGVIARNNLIYANSNQGILLDQANTYGISPGPQVINNTVYQPVGDAIRVQNNSRYIQIRNNILRVDAGYALNVDNNSQQGFFSDYNLLQATGAGQLGRWQGQDFTSLLDWYYELGFDGHGTTADPQFVDRDGLRLRQPGLCRVADVCPDGHPAADDGGLHPARLYRAAAAVGSGIPETRR